MSIFRTEERLRTGAAIDESYDSVEAIRKNSLEHGQEICPHPHAQETVSHS